MKSFLQNLLLLLLLCSATQAIAQRGICNPPFFTAGNEPPGCQFCGEEFLGSTAGFTKFELGVDFPCGVIDNNFFLTFLPDSTGTLEVEVIASNCQNGGGVQAVFFDETLRPLGNCTSSSNPSDPGILKVTGLEKDEKVIFMVDGFAGDICDIKLTVLQGTNRTIPPMASEPIQIVSPNQTDPNLVCNATEIIFKINQIPTVTDYAWTIDKPANFNPDPTDTLQIVRFLNPGIAKVSVTPFAACQQGPTTEITVDVKESPKYTFPTQPVCLTRLPVEIDGNIFSEIGTFEVSYPYLTCDSIVTYTLTQRPQNFLTLDTAVCDEYPLIFNGELYDSIGNFQIIFPNINPNLCDTSLVLDLRIPNRVAPQITCLTDSFLNAVAIKWDDIELAQKYQIRINGNLESVQTHTSLLYFPPNPGADLDITIKPTNALACSFPIGETTCKAPGTVSNQNINLASKIAVFPNPSSGIFEIFSKVPLRKIEVLDFSGKVVFKNSDFKNERIDLSDEAEGIYFFKIKSEAGVFVKKVLVQK